MARASIRGRVDWALFLLILVSSGGLSAFLPGTSTAATIVLSSALMAVSILPELGRGLSVLLSNPLVFFLAAWSLMAGLLSPRPALAILFTTVAILIIVFSSLRQSSVERTIETFALGTTVAIAPSVVGLVAPIVPVYRYAGSSNGYAGYFPWNSAAGLCAAALLLSLVLVYFQTGLAWWLIPAAAVGLLMIVLSKSVTAMLALAAGLGVLGVQAVMRRASARTKPLMILAIGIIVLLVMPKAVSFLSRKSVAEVTGRNESFSGRTLIWTWAREGILESPYWGHGTDFWQSVGLWSKSGHNGFIDTALSSGVPAAVALCAIVVLAAVRLATTSSVLLPFLAFGVTANLALSQLVIPGLAALALWLAVGATVRVGEAGIERRTGVGALTISRTSIAQANHASRSRAI